MARSWGERLWSAAAFQFCFIGAVALLKPAANALVLSYFNASVLPWLYLGASLITGALAISGGRGRRPASPAWLAFWGGLTSLGLALGLWLEVPLLSVVAYLFAEAFAMQVSLAFWATVGDAFDARESRRAFTWINGVGMAGAIVGGLLAELFARRAGVLAMMVVGGLLLLVGSAVMRLHRSDLDARPAHVAARRASLKEIFSLPYTRHLALFILGYAQLQILADFVFRQRAVASLTQADMAALFGSHQVWTGVFCVAFQFVLAEPLLRRLGILRYVGLVPGGLGVLVAVTLVVPSVWSAWALKVFEGASSWSLLPVAMQLLYAPLPDEARDGARRSIDGLLRKAGVGIAGVVLLVLAPRLGSNGVLALAGGLCVGMGWLLWRLRSQYVEAVHARVAGVSHWGVSVADEGLLGDALRSPSVERALRAADLLQQAGLVTVEHARRLLAHPHEHAQLKGVALAEAGRFVSVARQLEAMVAAPAKAPRVAAMWALAQLDPERAAVVLTEQLSSSDTADVAAAVGGLLSIDEARFPLAHERLEGLLSRCSTAAASERREVARMLGRLRPAPPRLKVLKELLDDPVVSVRRIAIGAIGASGAVELAPRLIRFLSWRDERRVARDALAMLGDAAVPLVGSALDDRSRALALRLQLPRVLRRIGTQAAFDVLLFSNGVDDPSLIYRVGAALSLLHESRPELVVDGARVLAALERRREATPRLVTAWVDARFTLGETSLLTRVLRDRIDQSLKLSFALLGLLHDGRALGRVQSHLMGGDVRRRAWALELAENLLSPEEQVALRPQLEIVTGALPRPSPEGIEPALAWLTRSDDYVLRACSRRVARALDRWAEPVREDDMNEHIVRRLFALEGVEVFAQSDVDDLAAIAAVAKEQDFHRGDQIYAEGDPGDALYVIVEGEVEARTAGEVVLTMRARESFGETSLFDGAPRINEVVALAETRTLVIDRRDFLDLLADRPELLTGMFRVLSRQLKSMVVEVAARRASQEIPVVAPQHDEPQSK